MLSDADETETRRDSERVKLRTSVDSELQIFGIVSWFLFVYIFICLSFIYQYYMFLRDFFLFLNTCDAHNQPKTQIYT